MAFRATDVEELMYYHQGRDFLSRSENQWMTDCLTLNPTYTGWGNGCEYMWSEGNGWDSELEFYRVNSLFELDDLNELVHFYFYLDFPMNYMEDESPYDDNNPITLGLQMWLLHPRKGASRGAILHRICYEDLPVVLDYLRGARDRNQARFSQLG